MLTCHHRFQHRSPILGIVHVVVSQPAQTPPDTHPVVALKLKLWNKAQVHPEEKHFLSCDEDTGMRRQIMN